MIQLPLMDAGSTDFPDTRNAMDEPNGLLAFGGDLSVQQLLAAYRKGIFPWFDHYSPILWWTPSPRLVIWPAQLHISKSMKKLLRKQPYRVTTDVAFSQVMAHCAEPRGDDQGTWITEDMVTAYEDLHNSGHAHSVEVWDGTELIGGLYGVAVGATYFGESMFSRRANASKYGFITLVLALEAQGFTMIDCQVHSDHLASLGAIDITREEFEENLADNENKTAVWPSNAQINHALQTRLK